MHKTKKILHSFHLMHCYLLNSLSLYYILYSDHYNATQLQNASHISTCLMVNMYLILQNMIIIIHVKKTKDFTKGYHLNLKKN